MQCLVAIADLCRIAEAHRNLHSSLMRNKMGSLKGWSEREHHCVVAVEVCRPVKYHQ